LKDKCKIEDQPTVDSVLALNTELNKLIEKDKVVKNLRWKPKKFEFDNMFSYGEGNVVDFSKAKDVMGLFAPNACGKSSIFSALSFCIFDKFDRGYKAVDIMNVQKSTFRCKFNFEINGVDFFIERKAKMDRKGNVKVDVKFWKEENGKVIELNGEARRNTNDIIRDSVGSYEDFVLTSLSVQNVKNVASFIDMGQSDRKDLLSKFIGLTIFDKLLEVASDKSKDVAASLKAYKKDDFELKLNSYVNESSQLTSLFNDETNQVKDLTETRSLLSDKLLEETQKLKPTEGKVVDIQYLNTEIPRKEEELRQAKNTNVIVSEKLSVVDRNISELDLQLTDLETKKVMDTYKVYQKLKSELSHIEQIFELKKVDVGNKLKKKDLLKKHEYDPNCKYCVESVFVKDAKKIEVELENDKVKVKEILVQKNKINKELETIEWSVSSQEQYTNLLKKRNEVKNQQSTQSSKQLR
jgi:hypothetical protein